MKLKIVSDIHTQHWVSPKFWDNIANADADVLVLAGDIVSLAPRMYQETKAKMAQLCSIFGKPVLYVLGNHEFYGTWPSVALDIAFDLEQEIPNLHWIRRDCHFEDNGIRVLGDTMWFPKPKDPLLSSTFSDFHCIRNLQPWVYQEHKKFIEYLNKELKEGDIVITHHAPSYSSCASEYVGDPYNVFFIAPAEEIIVEKKPSLWIHGHTHTSFAYEIDKTRVICNPLGYKMENQQDSFNPNLVVEV